MKPVWWVVIVAAAFIFITGLMMLVTRVFSEPPKSWWWTIITIIILFFIMIIVGGVLLFLKLRKKQPQKEIINAEDAEIRAINSLKYDADSPDNFIRKNRKISMVGEAGKDRTPILWLQGEGSENKQKIDMLVRLDNPNLPVVFLFGESNNYVKQTIVEFAENPERVVVEERIPTFDESGRPATTIRTHRMSRAEQQQKEEEKEALEKEAI